MDPKKQQRTLLVIAATVVLAVLAAGVAIVISSNNAPTANRDYSSIPFSRMADGGFVLGNADAPITIVEFADFTCPHCQDYQATVERIIDELVVTGQAKFEYRMFMATGSPYREYTAQLAQCADEQKAGAFWPAHDVLFELTSQGRFDEMARIVAERIELDYTELLNCARTADQYVTDQRLGTEAGVQGTPAVMVRYGDGELQWIPGYDRGGVPFEVLKRVVEAVQ